jgi:hypothetical protein
MLTSASGEGEDQTTPTPIEGLHAVGKCQVACKVASIALVVTQCWSVSSLVRTIVGEKIPIRARDTHVGAANGPPIIAVKTIKPKAEPHNITPEQLAQDSKPEDCWVALHGTFYYMTDFLPVHNHFMILEEKMARLPLTPSITWARSKNLMTWKWEHFWLPQVK